MFFCCCKKQSGIDPKNTKIPVTDDENRLFDVDILAIAGSCRLCSCEEVVTSNCPHKLCEDCNIKIREYSDTECIFCKYEMDNKNKENKRYK